MLDYLWEQDVYDRIKCTVLTDATIQKTEQKLGVRLPASYKAFMKGQNGGDLAYSEFHSRKFNNGEVMIHSLFSIDDNDGIGNLSFFQKNWFVPQNLIILTGDAEEWLALDYRSTFSREPKVVWYSRESNRITTIAQNFEQLLLHLQLPQIEEEDEDEQISIFIHDMHNTERDFHSSSF